MHFFILLLVPKTIRTLKSDKTLLCKSSLGSLDVNKKNQIELRKQQNQSENIQGQKCLIAILHWSIDVKVCPYYLDEVDKLEDVDTDDEVDTLEDVDTDDEVDTLEDVDTDDEVDTLEDVDTDDEVDKLEDVDTDDDIEVLDDDGDDEETLKYRLSPRQFFHHSW